MKHPIRALMALCLAATLAACGSDNDPDPEAATAQLSVIHASSDAPAVDIDLNGFSFGRGVDFKQAVPNQSVSAGSAEIVVRGILPGTARPVVIGPARVTLDAGRRYAVLAVNRVTAIEPLVIARDATAVPAGSTRLQVVHAAPAAPRVAVYVTAPNANLAASAPAGTVSFKESFGPVAVTAGTYQIRVTPAGTPGTVVFDSGPVNLQAGADLLVSAVPNTTTGTSPITLFATTVAGGSIEILDRSAPARVRVIHASPDAPAVDVVVNDNFAQPLVAALAFPAATPFVEVPGGTYNVKVTPAGNRGVIVINANPAFAAGAEYSVYAVGRLAAIEPLVLRDDRRRVATQAKVRILHASPTAGPVDLYVVARGASIAQATPAFAGVPFKADTGYVSLAAGQYDVVVTPTGSKVAAIGPAPITVAASGVYSIAARDAAGGGAPLSVILLDDFAP
jgi:hypothetical protein